MNYPIWDVPAGGLLIAAVAVVHVFISHFAIGGGLFLVLTERRARRENDGELLDYLKRHSRFFAVLTLVAGAVTGVGIWFTIALVNPQGTATLINVFVWGWAIEWTFFVIEIAAALVYYYGWQRLDARSHMAVGWVYFVAAWASLFIINGIVTFMLTPGHWLRTRGFWDGFFNPTFWPSLLTRTVVAMGLAGLYAMLTASRSESPALREKVARWAGLRWVLPMGLALPVALLWYLSAAASAGVPVARFLGAEGEGLASLVAAILSGPPDAGHPMAQRGAVLLVVASILTILLTLDLAKRRRRRYGTASTVLLMVLGFAAMAGGEWVREDLRKPWVIGRYMFVNSIRLPAPESAPAATAERSGESGAADASGASGDSSGPGPQVPADPFSVTALQESGVLAAADWMPPPEGFDPVDGADGGMDPEAVADLLAEAGRRIFVLECRACHTVDGYVAIRPLVRGRSVGAVENILDRLAEPVDATGQTTSWSDPELRLRSWRDRRMPPFVGTEAEEHALAMYLARFGGADLARIARLGIGARYFESECAFCHGPDEDWPMGDLLRGRERSRDDYYELLGRLPEVNELMIDFEGTDQERGAVADYLLDLQRQANEAPDETAASLHGSEPGAGGSPPSSEIDSAEASR